MCQDGSPVGLGWWVEAGSPSQVGTEAWLQPVTVTVITVIDPGSPLSVLQAGCSPRHPGWGLCTV